MAIPGLIRNLLTNFTAGVVALAFAAEITVSSQAEESAIQFVALVNTNDPASVVATGTLTGSNLDLTVSVPPNTARVQIIAGQIIWEIAALPPRPVRQTKNLPPPLPPIPPR